MCCMIAMMIVIFLFSAQKNDDSQVLSHSISDPVESFIESKSTKTFETEDEKTEHFKKLKDQLNTAVRKNAHVFLYSLLGLFMFLFVHSLCGDDYRAAVYTLFFCMLYAASDELHQRFVEARNGHFQDVCIDLFGTAVMLMLIYVVKAVKRRSEK